MDREEYHQKLDELTESVRKKDYKKALAVADEVDWRRVKSINTLNMVADVYEVNKDYKKTKEILLLALNRASIGRSILYRLVEVCLKLNQVDEAEKYFKEFSKTAKNDNSRCILQYKLYKAKHAPLEAQIDVLEEYRDKEYTERWAYELAKLYAKAGDRKKCVDACDDLILWFSEGKYVLKAMELKKKYEPLTPSQQQAYDRMIAAYRLPRSNDVLRDIQIDDEDTTTEEDASDRADAVAERARESEASQSQGGFRLRELKKEDLTPEVEQIPDRRSAAKAGSSEDPDLSDEDETEENESTKQTAPAGASTADSRPEDKAGSSSDEDADPEEELREASRKAAAASGITPAAMAAAKAKSKTKTGSGKNGGRMNTGDFDLDAFLAETAGSFSSEIGKDAQEEKTEAPEDAAGEKTAEADAGKPAGDLTPAAAADAGDNSVKAAGSAEENSVPAATASGDSSSAAAGTAADAAASEEASSAAAEEDESAVEGAREVRPAVAETAADALKGFAAGVAASRAEEQKKAEEQSKTEEQAVTAKQEKTEEQNAPVKQEKKKPHYIEELEVPDPEPTEEEKKNRTHTIPLGTIGQNTVPISIDKILSEETPEERRIRILNKEKPTRMSEEQRNIFTYFARIPGMDSQILEAIGGVYEHAGERTSLHGNIAIMGARGTGKSRLAHGLVVAMCRDLGMDAAKVARISGKKMNEKDPAKVVSMMSGGFLMLEEVSDINEETLDKLNQAMEFRTDCMIVIIEDEKTRMRAFLKAHPQFAAKFEKVISIPVFTNDELVTFARTYATENGCKIDDMAILALYTMIGNIQSEDEPATISEVKDMIDAAMEHAAKGRRRKGRDDAAKSGKWLVLHEKDFTQS